MSCIMLMHYLYPEYEGATNAKTQVLPWHKAVNFCSALQILWVPVISNLMLLAQVPQNGNTAMQINPTT